MKKSSRIESLTLVMRGFWEGRRSRTKGGVEPTSFSPKRTVNCSLVAVLSRERGGGRGAVLGDTFPAGEGSGCY